jgi:hypothetical protein
MLFFKVFFIWKYIKIIYFDINTLKQFKNTKKINLKYKNTKKFKNTVGPRFQTLS